MVDASMMSAAEPARLLLIDGTRTLANRLKTPVAAEFDCMPVIVELTTGRQALEVLRSSPFDVVAADLDALADLAERVDERIARLARAAVGALMLILAEDTSISIALAAMRSGAHDCVGKAIDGGALVGLIGELAQRHGKARVMTRAIESEPVSLVRAEPAPSIPDMSDLVLPMWRQEQRIIEEAIQRYAGNISMAAAALELSPSTIYRKRQSWADMDGKRGAASAL